MWNVMMRLFWFFAGGPGGFHRSAAASEKPLGVDPRLGLDTDPLCNFNGNWHENCGSPHFEWPPLLGREYCCNKYIEATGSAAAGCYWHEVFPNLFDNTAVMTLENDVLPVFPLEREFRTGLECQQACLAQPKCETWAYSFKHWSVLINCLFFLARVTGKK